MLVSTLLRWFTHRLKRIVKTAKLYFIDTGLLVAARGLTFDGMKADCDLIGAFLETFVYSQVEKLSAATQMRLSPTHFLDQQMREVDIFLEHAGGTIVGLEVKGSATVRPSDFGGLRTLAEASGERIAFGAVLYDRAHVAPCEDRMAAVPVSSPWA